MGTLYLNGCDLEAQLGFSFSDEGTVLDAMVSVPSEVELPGVPGTFFAGPAKLGAREFTLRGWLDGATQSEVRANLKKLIALVGEGLITVRVADWSDVMIEAKCVRFPAKSIPPEQVQVPCDVELTFRAPCPYWRDVVALPYGLSSTPTAIPCGTASVAPDYWIWPASATAVVNPSIIGYDHRGVEQWRSRFLITLAQTDALRIVTSAFDMTIWKYVNAFAGTIDDSLLSSTAPSIFPKALYATRQSYRFSQWQLLALTADSGTPIGRAVFPRMWG